MPIPFRTLLLWLVGASIVCAAYGSDLYLGMSRVEALTVLGEPLSAAKGPSKEILFFNGNIQIQIKGGVVKAISGTEYGYSKPQSATEETASQSPEPVVSNGVSDSKTTLYLGMSRQAVIAALGKPVSVVKGPSKEILVFEGKIQVQIKGGVASAISGAKYSYSKPKPVPVVVEHEPAVIEPEPTPEPENNEPEPKPVVESLVEEPLDGIETPTVVEPESQLDKSKSVTPQEFSTTANNVESGADDESGDAEEMTTDFANSVVGILIIFFLGVIFRFVFNAVVFKFAFIKVGFSLFWQDLIKMSLACSVFTELVNLIPVIDKYWLNSILSIAFMFFAIRKFSDVTRTETAMGIGVMAYCISTFLANAITAFLLSTLF